MIRHMTPTPNLRPRKIPAPRLSADAMIMSMDFVKIR